MKEKTKQTTAKSTTASNKTYSLGGQHSTSGMYGWICPVCGRGVAPHQKYCGCRPYVTPVYPAYPVYPYWWYQVTCDSTGKSPTSVSTKDYTTGPTSYTTTASTATNHSIPAAEGYINNFGINPNAQERSIDV